MTSPEPAHAATARSQSEAESDEALSYRELLAVPDVRRLYAGWALARLPSGMNATVILLVATHLSSLTIGGLAAATYSIGVATGTFGMSEIVGRLGPSRALARYAVVHAAAQLALAATAGGVFGHWGDRAEIAALIVAAAAVGLSVPPSSQCLRALWGHVLPERASRTTGSLEGATTNTIFILGPALAGLSAVGGISALAPIVSAAASLAGCLTLATAVPMRRWSAEARTSWPLRPHWRALRVPGAARQLGSLTLIMAAAAGADISLFDIGVVNGFFGGGALLLTAAGVTSILASVWHGMTRPSRSTVWWLWAMTLVIAAAGAVVVVLTERKESDAASIAAIALLLAVQVPISVLFIDLVLVVSPDVAPTDRVAVLAWRTAANLTGNATGQSLTGLVIAGVVVLGAGPDADSVGGGLFAVGCALVGAAALGVVAGVLQSPRALPRHRGIVARTRGEAPGQDMA